MFRLTQIRCCSIVTTWQMDVVRAKITVESNVLVPMVFNSVLAKTPAQVSWIYGFKELIVKPIYLLINSWSRRQTDRHLTFSISFKLRMNLQENLRANRKEAQVTAANCTLCLWSQWCCDSISASDFMNTYYSKVVTNPFVKLFIVWFYICSNKYGIWHFIFFV